MRRKVLLEERLGVFCKVNCKSCLSVLNHRHELLSQFKFICPVSLQIFYALNLTMVPGEENNLEVANEPPVDLIHFLSPQEMLFAWEEKYGSLADYWAGEFLRNRCLKEIIYFPSKYVFIALERERKLENILQYLKLNLIQGGKKIQIGTQLSVGYPKFTNDVSYEAQQDYSWENRTFDPDFYDGGEYTRDY